MLYAQVFIIAKTLCKIRKEPSDATIDRPSPSAKHGTIETRRHGPNKIVRLNMPSYPISSETSFGCISSFIIELLHDQMQEEIHVDPQRTFEEIHELSVVELRL